MGRYVMLIACCACVVMAWAEDSPRQPRETLSATEALLRVQASGEQASRHLQVQTAKERDLSKQRWLDSYKYAIPDFYRWSKVTDTNN